MTVRTPVDPRSADDPHGARPARRSPGLFVANTRFLAAGTLFGLIAIKSEIVSWYRIQEMFRFQSFHMYGVIASAVAVAALSLWLLRRFGVHSLDGERIALRPKRPGVWRYLLGGTLFGLGWAATGACPGPILALIGSGFGGFVLVLASAVLGTWVYGNVRDRLPH